MDMMILVQHLRLKKRLQEAIDILTERATPVMSISTRSCRALGGAAMVNGSMATAWSGFLATPDDD